MPSGIYKRTKLHKIRISESLKGVGHPCSAETKEKLRQFNLGKKHSLETILKMKKARQFVSLETRKKLSDSHKREKSYRWISDRTKLSRLNKQGERRTSAYFNWRKEVWLRDRYKCKIANPDCKGKIEAHHILSWRDYPELRYQVNNGITLCHAHHPRKRAEEKRLSPYFAELVSASKDHNF